MYQVWTYLTTHPAMVSGFSLFSYHVLSAFIGALEMPDNTSGKLYRFFFNFANLIAANYSRAKASNGVAGQQPPKGGTQ
jgi:hypothetical protein